MTHRPPRLAAALLRWFGPQDEAIAGDLVEGFHRRSGSRIWYWWQVASALRVAAVREVGRHPIAVPATMMLGWVAWWALLYHVAYPVMLAANHAIFMWRIGRGDDAQLFGQAFMYTSLALAIAADLISAILAVRIYPGHRSTLALLYAGFVVLRCVAWRTLDSIYFNPGSPLSFVMNFRPFGIGAIVNLFPMPFLMALAGGMWAASRRQIAARPHQ